MLYATAELYLPSGELLRQQVVETCDGEVISFATFACENHAMTFVPEIHLHKKNSDASIVLYACVRNLSGEWIVLE